MKRSIVGALLFLILVGEPTVGRTSGLFTPAGIGVFTILYLSYFLFFDSLVYSYKLNNLQMVLVNFAFYSVLITGLLHGELRDYVLHPHNDLVTTLIRIQCSFFPLYAYPLLNRLAPGTKPRLKVTASMSLFAGAMVLLSLTRHFGIIDLLDTFRIAPHIALAFIIGAVGALIIALRLPKSPLGKSSPGRAIELWAWVFLIICSVPLFSFFLILIPCMTIVSICFLMQKNSGP